MASGFLGKVNRVDHNFNKKITLFPRETQQKKLRVGMRVREQGGILDENLPKGI